MPVHKAEEAVLGRSLDALPVAEARRAILGDITPIDDIRASAHYRTVVTANVLGQMLTELGRVRTS